MAETYRGDGNNPMIIVPRKGVPGDILSNSVLAHIAAAYFSVGKRLERKTQCSATRGFILLTLRGDAMLNQNQIATLLVSPTELWCIGPSSQWFRKDLCRRGRLNRAGQFMSS